MLTNGHRGATDSTIGTHSVEACVKTSGHPQQPACSKDTALLQVSRTHGPRAQEGHHRS